jgi:hypothetical protein
MKTQYAVYNARTNSNEFYDTKAEATLAFWNNVVSFARSHYYKTAYMVVETNDDGSQKWYNDKSNEIEAPKTVAEIDKMIADAIK